MEKDYLISKAQREIEKGWRDPKVRGQAVWVDVHEGNEKKTLAPTKTEIHPKGKSLILRRNKYFLTSLPELKKKQNLIGLHDAKNFKLDSTGAKFVENEYKSGKRYTKTRIGG